MLCPNLVIAAIYLAVMRYVAAYALAVLGGHEHPTVDDLERIITSVGGEFDRAHAETLVKALAGKAIHEVIKASESKLASLPVGGVAAPAASASAPSAAKEEKKETKKEEAKEEEEDAALGGGGLFGEEEW